MTNFGLDPSWVRLYPYQVLAAPGDTLRLRVHAQNYKPSPMKIEVALVAPPEWKIEPDVVKFEVPANSAGERPVSVAIPKSWTPRAGRFAIAADVVSDGKYLGQITEAVVDLKGAASY